jgi:O-antigen ligase
MTLFRNVPLIILLSVMAITPYFRGLFFNEQLNVYLVTIGLLIVVYFKMIKVNTVDMGSFNTYWYYALFLLPLYFLLLSFQAVSLNLNNNELFKYLALAGVFFIVINAVKNEIDIQWLQMAILFTGFWISVYGLFNLYGLAEFRDAVLGDRLASVFQYPNTYATFLVATLLAAILYSVNNNYRLSIMALIVLTPIFVSIILTYSRGGWLLLPIMFLIMIVIIPASRQLLIIIYTAVLSLPTLSIIPFIFESISTKNAGLGLGLIVTGQIGTVIVGWILSKFKSKYSKQLSILDKKLVFQFIMPTALILLGIIGLYLLFENDQIKRLLPGSVAQRIENINFNQHSVLERNTFNEDALKIYNDYPVFGAGGGAWKTLYQKYQNNPYISTQSHNYYSQLLVEVGTVGTLLFVAIYGLMFMMAVQRYRKYNPSQKMTQSFFAIIALTILAHSMIDFNMSYGYIALLLFISLAAMCLDLNKVGENQNKPNSSNIAKIKMKKNFSQVNKNLVRVHLLIIIIFVFALIINFRYVLADNHYEQGVGMIHTGEFNNAMSKFESAVSLQSNNIGYLRTLGQLKEDMGRTLNDQSLVDEGKNIYERMVELEPLNPDTHKQLATFYKKNGEYGNALEHLRLSVSNAVWDQNVYDDMILTAANAATLEQVSKQELDSVIETYNRIPSMLEHLKTLPEGQGQGRPFGYTETMYISMGRVHYHLGEWTKAHELIVLTHESPDVARQKSAYIYSIAALLKQERTNEANKFRQEAVDKGIQISDNEIQQVLEFPIIK